jgi:hypothetical protein
MSDFFIEKFNSVSKAYFSLNGFGFYSGGINPFLQSRIYKSFCLSKLLYGLEIFYINKTTIKKINTSQNDIIRYITGISKHCHISEVLEILKIFKIEDLNIYSTDTHH